MLKLSGCLEMLYRAEAPNDFMERINLIADTGVPAIEFWSWRNKDLDAVKATAEKNNLAIAGFVDQTSGTLVDASQRDAFVQGTRESCQTANRLNCKTLIVTVGQEIPGVPRIDQHASIVEGLKAVAPIVEAAGVTLVVEPLNILVNHKGYYLYQSDEGFEIVREVGSPNVKLLFDIYHQQVSEGNLLANISANLDLIGHFHVADCPGRNQPGTGEINYPNIFKYIADSPYQGYVGLEYMPKDATSSATLRSVVMMAEAAKMTAPAS